MDFFLQMTTLQLSAITALQHFCKCCGRICRKNANMQWWQSSPGGNASSVFSQSDSDGRATECEHVCVCVSVKALFAVAAFPATLLCSPSSFPPEVIYYLTYFLICLTHTREVKVWAALLFNRLHLSLFNPLALETSVVTPKKHAHFVTPKLLNRSRDQLILAWWKVALHHYAPHDWGNGAEPIFIGSAGWHRSTNAKRCISVQGCLLGFHWKPLHKPLALNLFQRPDWFVVKQYFHGQSGNYIF